METQHHIDTFQNHDKVLKESFSLFKGESLGFLDEELADVVTDILGTELTETTTKKAYADNALKLSSNKGLHTECEAHISRQDIMRFASYNIDLSRMHDIPFTTVIITTQKPGVTSYTNPSVTFAPKIINLKERDADKVLADIDKKLKAGDYSSINLLEIIYLPLYGSESGKTTAQLLDKAIKLAPQVAKNDKPKQRKLHDLMILLAGSLVSDNELGQILEANMINLENNAAVRVLKSMGRSQREIEIAQNMLLDGDDYVKISRMTGLDIERIAELDSELLAKVV